jgi:hypothetical protein
MTSPAFTVSGPGVDKPTPSPAVGVSLALTHAGRARTEATFYVRDREGRALYRVERDSLGVIRTWQTKRGI